MTIPTGGFAALLAIASFALTSCGNDDATATVTATATATATATTTPAAPSKAAQTTTQKTQTSAAPSTTAQTTTRTTQKTQTSTAPSKSKPPATQKAQAGVCPAVEVGSRDGDVDVTFGRITQQRKVDCQTATIVVSQWGRQQLGVDRALLPLGWKCSAANVCTNGASRVSFVLERPEST